MTWIIVSFIGGFILGGSAGMLIMGALCARAERKLVELLCLKIDELLKERENLYLKEN